MSAETAADPDLDPPEDPTAEIVVSSGGPSHVYHRPAGGDGEPEPDCVMASEADSDWRSAELQQYAGRRPCRFCYSEGTVGGDNGNKGNPCPLCGVVVASLAVHVRAAHDAEEVGSR